MLRHRPTRISYFQAVFFVDLGFFRSRSQPFASSDRQRSIPPKSPIVFVTRWSFACGPSVLPFPVFRTIGAGLSCVFLRWNSCRSRPGRSGGKQAAP